MSRPNLPYLPSLTALRYFAAIGVLIGHSIRPFHFPDPPPWMSGGFGAGVSFFFVLSGFVLALNHSGMSTRSWGEYYYKRFARIAPLYWFAGLLAVGIWIFHGSWDRAIGGLDVLPGGEWTALALFFSALQAWVPLINYQIAFDSPAWSLSVEAFFYLVFPLLLVLSTRQLLLIALPLCVAIIFGCIVATQHLTWLQTDRSNVLVKFFPPARLLEFVFGILTARLFVVGRGFPIFADQGRRTTMILSFAGLGFVLLWTFGRSSIIGPIVGLFSLSRVTSAYLFYGGGFGFYAASIFCFALADCGRSKPVIIRFLASRPMQLLGNASFAVYLIHVPLRVAVSPDLMRPWWGFVVYFAFVHLVAIGAYLLIERPAQRGLNNWYRRRKTPPSLPVPMASNV